MASGKSCGAAGSLYDAPAGPAERSPTGAGPRRFAGAPAALWPPHLVALCKPGGLGDAQTVLRCLRQADEDQPVWPPDSRPRAHPMGRSPEFKRRALARIILMCPRFNTPTLHLPHVRHRLSKVVTPGAPPCPGPPGFRLPDDSGPGLPIARTLTNPARHAH